MPNVAVLADSSNPREASIASSMAAVPSSHARAASLHRGSLHRLIPQVPGPIPANARPPVTATSINWFMHTFFSATIPNQAKEDVNSASVDWTSIIGFDVTRDYRVEEEVRKVQEPEDSGEIGTLNQRLRLIRSADGDALGGHRTATNKTSAGGFTGYYGHIITPTRGAPWNGDPNSLPLGPLPPKYIPHARAIPAQNDNALNSLNAALAALETFPNLKEIIADKGYTIYGEAFVRPLHQMGINVVMDYTKGHQETIETVTIGPEGEEQVLMLHCGTSS